MTLVDTHAHLLSLITGKRFSFPALLDEMHDAGVKACFNVLLSETESSRLSFLGEAHREKGIVIRHLAGIHPHDAEKWDGSDRWIRDIAHEIIAVGEVGMDLHYRFSPEETQVSVFRRMVTLAVDLGKPIVIHGRKAEEWVMAILDEFPAVGERVLFHCYTGSLETAQKIFDRGWSIGITGIVTFPQAEDIREIVRVAPPGHLCFETDSPYLAPVPHRGKVNRPAYVADIYRFVADFTGIALEEWERRAEQCVRRVFGDVL